MSIKVQKDLSGQRFNDKFTVLRLCGEHTTTGGNKEPLWLCLCDCGKEFEARGYRITRGRTKSCGCSHKTKVYRKYATPTWHGESRGEKRTAEYRTWRSMWDRFKYKEGYKDRPVCERWKVYENFLADMGRKPSPKHSIDRIDNNLGYFPENCRWATNLEQNYNRGDNRLLTFQGRTQPLTAWARELGFEPHLIELRLDKRMNWSVERALTTPKRYRGPNKTKPV